MPLRRPAKQTQSNPTCSELACGERGRTGEGGSYGDAAPWGSTSEGYGVFVMPYLCGAGLPNDYCNNIKAAGSVFNLVGCEKIPGGSFHSGFFSESDGRLDRLEIFACPCFDLDEDNASIAIDHNKVNLTSFTGEIADEFAQAFSFQIPFTVFFTPSAEQFCVSQKLASVQQPTKQFLRISFRFVRGQDCSTWNLRQHACRAVASDERLFQFSYGGNTILRVLFYRFEPALYLQHSVNGAGRCAQRLRHPQFSAR